MSAAGLPSIAPLATGVEATLAGRSLARAATPGAVLKTNAARCTPISRPPAALPPLACVQARRMLLIVDVQNGVAMCGQVIAHQHAVALELHPFGAHDRRLLAARPFQPGGKCHPRTLESSCNRRNCGKTHYAARCSANRRASSCVCRPALSSRRTLSHNVGALLPEIRD